MKTDQDYRNWIIALKGKVRAAQVKAVLAVNQELILFYWELGKMLSDKLKESQWGEQILENVSKDLKKEFPDLKGLSRTNLVYCRSFFEFYHSKISQQAVDQIKTSTLK